MEKPWIKRIINAGSVLMLLAVLCACGKGSERESADIPSPGSDIRIPDDVVAADVPGYANAALAKENVYRVSAVELPDLADGGSISVKCTAREDGRIYTVLEISDWENEPQYCIFSMDENGNVRETVFLELPGNEGEPTEEEKESAGDAVWEQKDVRYSDFAVGADGRCYALRQYRYSYVNNLTGQFLDGQRQYVCCWNREGGLLWQLETGGEGAEDVSPWAVFPRADGSLDLLLTGEKTYRLSVGQDGVPSEAGMERLSEATGKALESCRRLLRRADGTCLLLCRDGGEGLNLMEYDPRTDVLGEAVRLPDDLPATALSGTAFAAGSETDLLYAGRKGVFTYDMGEKQGCLKMNYVNSDRNITDAISLLELDGIHFFLFYREDYSRELKAGIFAYVKPEDIPDREVILLGGLTVNEGIKKRVIQYNRESEQYRVVLKEYGSVEDLNLEILSCRMPDILMAEGLPGGDTVPMESYLAKGLIADVRELIAEDPELSRTDFLENVFDAYSVDGRLPYVVPSFTLSVMTARSPLTGEGEDWSLERAVEALDGMAGDAQLLDGLDRSTFMEKVLEYRGRDFMDLKTGKCTFDSPEFIEVMQFAYTLPEERRYAFESGEGEYELQYLKGRTLLKELHIWSFGQNVDERLFYQLNGYLGGEYAFVGFPGGSRENAGNGANALICGENLMALSAVSENRQGAWDFARYYLSEEYQKNLESSLPVNRQIFEAWAKEETLRPYTVDEDGKKEEYDLTLYRDGKAVAVPPLDQGQLEEVIALVESASATPFEDAHVIHIIEEEMGGYFSGQKTVEDTAAVIQSRVQIYVQENQ